MTPYDQRLDHLYAFLSDWGADTCALPVFGYGSVDYASTLRGMRSHPRFPALYAAAGDAGLQLVEQATRLALPAPYGALLQDAEIVAIALHGALVAEREHRTATALGKIALAAVAAIAFVSSLDRLTSRR